MVLDALGSDVYIFTIPVDKAALLLALDHGQLDGLSFSENELGPYQQTEKFKDSAGREIGVWREVGEMLAIEPKGKLRQARDQLLDLLTRALNKADIKADKERRNIEGTLDVANTLIDIGVLAGWAEVHGIDVGDLMNEYEDNESKLVESLRETVFQWRDRSEAGSLWEEKSKGLDQLPESFRADYVRLLIENQKLRTAQQSTQVDRPLSKRAYDSLLKIIAAMAFDCYRDRIQKPWSVAKDIQVVAEQLGLDLSDDTIASKLKDATNLIPRSLR